MFHGCGESIAVYRCANKKVDAHAVYTNTVPAGAFRGYGLGQVDLRGRVGDGRAGARLGHRPVRAAPAQRRRAGRPDASSHARAERRPRRIGSYGLDQCLDLVEAALAGRRRRRAAGRRGWSANGIAIGDDRHHPAARPLSPTPVTLRRRRHATSSRSAPPSSATAPPPCTPRSPPTRWAPTPTAIAHPAVRHRRGGTTPARSARPAPWWPAWRCTGGRDAADASWPMRRARRRAGRRLRTLGVRCGVQCGADFVRAGRIARGRPARRAGQPRRHPAVGGVQRARRSGSRSTPRPARSASCSRSRPPTPAW